MKGGRYFIWFGLCLGVAFAVLTTLFVGHLGQPWWPHHLNREVLIAKRHLAEKADRPTIWLQGGSATWFGYDSEALSEATGRNVANLAFNAAMPMDFMAAELKRYAKSGDTILLGIEYVNFFRDRYTSFGADEIAVWDPDFFWTLSPSRKLAFLNSLSWRKAIAGNLVRFGRWTGAYERQLAFLEQDTVIDRFEQQLAGVYDGHIPAYYNYLNCNRFGDFIRDGSHPKWTGDSDYSLDGERTISASLKADLRDLRDWCEERGVSLCLVWTPMARDSGFDLNAADVAANLQQVRELGEALGLSWLGKPEDVFFERERFYDTDHHLTAEGASFRTSLIIGYLLQQEPLF